MSFPLVSLCVPTFNRANYLELVIQDLCAQSYQNIEILISDDNSCDATEQVVSKNMEPRIRYFRNDSNLGIPGNLNSLLARASGEYIAFCHDHDRYHPDFVLRQVAFLQNNASAGFVYADYIIAGQDSEIDWPVVTGNARLLNGPETGLGIVLRGSFSCPIHALCMIRASVLDSVGRKFSERYGFVSDVDLWLRLLLVSDVGAIDDRLIAIRYRDPSHEFALTSWKMFGWQKKVFDDAVLLYLRLFPDQHKAMFNAVRSASRRYILIVYKQSLTYGAQRLLAGLPHGILITDFKMIWLLTPVFWLAAKVIFSVRKLLRMQLFE